MIFEYAEIHLLDTPYFLDKGYDYFIPADMRGEIKVGSLVSVPFGMANRRQMAVVSALKERALDPTIPCKPIISLGDARLALTDEQLKLCFFLKEQTLCTFGEAHRAVIPSAVMSQLVEVYVASESDEPDENTISTFDRSTLSVYEYIRKQGSVRFDLLKSKFGGGVDASLRKLRECGAVFRTHVIRNKEEKTENHYQLNIDTGRALSIADGADADVKLRSVMHREILRALANAEGARLSEAELCEMTGASHAQIKALVDKGLVQKLALKVDRSIVDEYIGTPREFELSAQQSEALATLEGLLDSGEPKAALLHGITGSGKTCVMMKIIDRVLADNRGVILLLPEIALTPQTLTLFCSRYGSRVAVIHSALSAGERLDTYTRIKEGRADLVIGTRSAVFAPVRDLGLIIIDEEQEHTYKSDMDPKYHARDIARFRCTYNNALMLLASATPSLESYKKAMDGKYTLIKLTERFGEARLPDVTVYDMRPEMQSGNLSPLGAMLCRKLVKNKADGGQSILFLNRRGYNNFLSCRDCGESVKCPVCSVSMTYHTIGGSYDRGELRCHWCGRRAPTPTECPSCHGTHIARMGYGTQRVEQEISSLLPDASVLRMDADSASTKYAYEEKLGVFRRHEADILLGTQMVTKGHDFPDVTLVGVLLADASLYLDDYRASERTFAMITQVIGRAGRAQMRGEAIIQTNNPDNECIKLACAQDYEAFYEAEIRLRKLLVFPPFCDIALLTLSGANETEVLKAARVLADTVKDFSAKEFSDVPLISFGPFEAPVYKVENKYRMRMILKCRLNKRSRAMLSEIMIKFSKANVKGLSLSVDLNPSNI